MEPQVAFYQLGRKIVNNQERIPEDARQVLYYSLAIGHHVGVMDCFSEMMAIPAEGFRRWLAHLPEGDGRRKLEGVLAWDEIEINRSHVDDLLSAMKAALPTMDAVEREWANKVILSLRQIVAEPALYLMVKMRA